MGWYRFLVVVVQHCGVVQMFGWGGTALWGGTDVWFGVVQHCGVGWYRFMVEVVQHSGMRWYQFLDGVGWY